MEFRWRVLEGSEGLEGSRLVLEGLGGSRRVLGGLGGSWRDSSANSYIDNIYIYISVATWLKEFSSSGAWRPSTLYLWNGVMPRCRSSSRIGGGRQKAETPISSMRTPAPTSMTT